MFLHFACLQPKRQTQRKHELEHPHRHRQDKRGGAVELKSRMLFARPQDRTLAHTGGYSHTAKVNQSNWHSTCICRTLVSCVPFFYGHEIFDVEPYDVEVAVELWLEIKKNKTSFNLKYRTIFMALKYATRSVFFSKMGLLAKIGQKILAKSIKNITNHLKSSLTFACN